MKRVHLSIKFLFAVFLGMVLVISPLALAAEQDIDEATDKWLQEVQLGPYHHDSVDAAYEALLYELAKEEGEVNVYSYSSRVFKFGPTFEERYPGIKVNGFDMDSPEIVSKVLAEQEAGNYVADVTYLKDPATVYYELYEKGYVFTYVPPDLFPVLAAEHRDPLLVHHLSMDAFVYNTEMYDSCPFDNLWDLTKPEWRSKVLFPDPNIISEFVEVLGTIIQHPEEMAAAYEKEFGEEVILSPGVENAGYEWIKRLLDNDVIIVGSTNDVSNSVGAPGQSDPPVGMTAFSRLRDKEKDPTLVFEVAYDIEPIMGITTSVVVAIVNQAQHPNAAKLMVRWMLGDEHGGWGYEPYFVPGNIPTRSDVPAPPGTKTLQEMRTWPADTEFVWYEGQKIKDFWLLMQ
jgi:iron(III) transport system substrate-binding protein